MIDIYIGFRNTSSKGYEYEVIEKLPKGKWKVKFINTGYEAESDSKEVRNGIIRDWKAPYVCGIGVVGTELKSPQKHYLYDRWRDMLRRCYDPKCNMYPSYGAVGCYVVNEWHYFPTFVRDLEQKEKIDKIKFKGKEVWQLDKDYICNEKGIEPHYYSNETTCIITQKDNTKERNERQGNPAKYQRIKVMQFDTEGNYIKTWDSMSEAGDTIKNKKNSNIGNIVKCCQGNSYTSMGYCWMYEKDFVNIEQVKERLLNLKNKLNKKDEKYIKIVQQIDLKGNIINEDIAENIAKSLNVVKSTVYGAITRNNLCQGYRLQYKEEI